MRRVFISCYPSPFLGCQDVEPAVVGLDLATTFEVCQHVSHLMARRKRERLPSPFPVVIDHLHDMSMNRGRSSRRIASQTISDDLRQRRAASVAQLVG